MKVAVVGCGHGELDKMYETVAFLEKKQGIKIELLLCCGDFQSVRNAADLSTMACPQKYRKMNTFYKYYSGECVAPIPTIFVGGNHEASNYLLELFHGGWVAPNIWFMGWAGVVNFAGIRIGGLTGIFKPGDFRAGHYESPPFDNSSMRSVYHVREFDVFKLLQYSKPIDIFLSHDWPQGIYNEGDTQTLLRKKKFLRKEVEEGSLGNPPARKLMEVLQPRYWFSAHLHVKFAGVMRHQSGRMTRFLALDKCLPHRDWMQVIDFPEATPARTFSYDEEWLAIVRSTNQLMCLNRRSPPMPMPHSGHRFDFRPTAEEKAFIRQRFRHRQEKQGEQKQAEQVPCPSPTAPAQQAAQAGAQGGQEQARVDTLQAGQEGQEQARVDTLQEEGKLYEIPNNFVMTAGVYSAGQPIHTKERVNFVPNQQTITFAETLGIVDLITQRFGNIQFKAPVEAGTEVSTAPTAVSATTAAPSAEPDTGVGTEGGEQEGCDPDEIDFGDF